MQFLFVQDISAKDRLFQPIRTYSLYFYMILD